MLESNSVSNRSQFLQYVKISVLYSKLKQRSEDKINESAPYWNRITAGLYKFYFVSWDALSVVTTVKPDIGGKKVYRTFDSREVATYLQRTG